MTTENIRSIIKDAEKYGHLHMTNEDGRSISLLDESTKTFLDESNDILISIRTNTNIGNQNKEPFSVSFIETDSIKQAIIELDLKDLKLLMEDRGLNVNEVKHIIDIQSGIKSASNWNVKYHETEDGKMEKDLPFMPSVTKG